MRPPLLYVPVKPDELKAAFEKLAAQHGEQYVLDQLGFDPRLPDPPRYLDSVKRYLASNPSYCREELLQLIHMTEEQYEQLC